MQLSEEERFIRDTAREFAESEIKPVALEYERDNRYPRDLVEKAGEIGLTSPMLPFEYGGGGYDLIAKLLIAEELLGADPGIGESVTASTFGVPMIAKHGSEFQIEEYVKPAASGEIVSAIAMTEPRGGSDFANIESRAKRTDDGYMLNGDKVFITNGSVADVVVVFARTSDTSPPHRGISAFLVEADDLERNRMEGYLGPGTIDVGQIFLDDVHVDGDALLGEEDQGFYYAMETMDESRLEVAAGAIGTARGALDIAKDYITDREVFEKPVSEYQAIRHEVADLETRLEAARCLVYSTAREYVNDQLEGPRKPAMAKLLSSELVEEVTSQAIQFHGGYGVFDEYRVESFFRWTKAAQIYDGTSQIMREIIAGETIDD